MVEVGTNYPNEGALLQAMPDNSGVVAVKLTAGGLKAVRFNRDIHLPYGKNIWECAKIGARQLYYDCERLVLTKPAASVGNQHEGCRAFIHRT